MRHRRAGRKLGRTSSHRKALLRNMVTELLDKEQIRTTLPKAKELRPVAEKMITLGKRETLHARRQALSFIRRKEVVHKLFESLAPRYADRHGGYTRIIRLGFRQGDQAEMALIQLVTDEAPAAEESKPSKSKTKKKAAGGESEEKAGKPKKTRRKKESEEESGSEE